MAASTLYKCGRCSRPLQRPPSLRSLRAHFPSLALTDITVDRMRPRCRHCDERAVLDRITDIECPPPFYTNPAKQLERTMERVRAFIAAGVRVEELTVELDSLRSERAQMGAQTDLAVEAVWREYWALWGKKDGQEDM